MSEQPIKLLAVNTAPTFTISDGRLITKVSNHNDIGQSLIQQDDGKLVMVGYSEEGPHWSSDSDISLIRLNSDGTFDATFNGDGKLVFDINGESDRAKELIVQEDGKYVITTNGSYFGDTEVAYTDFNLIRLNTDGSLDTSFDDDGKLSFEDIWGLSMRTVRSVIQQSDGKLLLAGSATPYPYNFGLMRLNEDGSLDTSFDINGYVSIDVNGDFDGGHSVIQQSDGKIVVAGYSGINDDSDYSLIRLNTDGSLDTSFDGDGKVRADLVGANEVARSVVQQVNGKLVVAGSDFGLVRFNEDGSLDTNFGVDGKVAVDVVGGDTGVFSGFWEVIQQTDGKLVAAGYNRDSYSSDSTEEYILVRVNEDGSLDSNFGNDGIISTDVGGNGNNYAFSVIQQADGKLVVAGFTRDSSDRSYFSLIRYNDDGSIDETFTPAENTLDSTPTTTEQISVVMDSNVQVRDVELQESGNYAGSTLTLVRTDGANTEDTFASVGTLTELIEGGYFGINDTTIGSVIENSGGILKLSFNDNATELLVNQTMQQLTYQNISDAPPETATIDWTFSDGNTGEQGGEGALSITGSTTVTIEPVNDAPVRTTSLDDVEVLSGSEFVITLPALVFLDPDGEDLTYSINLVNGTALPPWIALDSASGTISGVPVEADAGSFYLSMMAEDSNGLTASDSFYLTVNVPDSTPPVLHEFTLPETFDVGGDYIYLDISTNYTDSESDLSQYSITFDKDIPFDGGVSNQFIVELSPFSDIPDYDMQNINSLYKAGVDAANIALGVYAVIQVDITDSEGNVATYTTSDLENLGYSSSFEVVNVNDLPVGEVSITGTASQGEILTADPSALVDPDGIGTFSYQWKSDGAVITGATDSTYTLTQAEVGTTVTVEVSYEDGIGTVETITSEATGLVANINDLPSGSVSITGTKKQGSILTASNTLSDADGIGTISYQWYADGDAISGATGSTYTLTQSDVGKGISVAASYTDDYDTNENVVSDETVDVLGSEKNVVISTFYWNESLAIEGVSLTDLTNTGRDGKAVISTDSAVVLNPSLNTDSVANHAVGLQDAIFILKQIVGLEDFNSYQEVAADFDQNDSVGLNDAIGILKHVVGLSAPDPEWLFIKSGATTPLADGSLEVKSEDTEIELVGVLVGDVDGSWEAV